MATILSEAARDLQFTITFADGTTVRYPVVREVVEQPNPTSNAIVSLIGRTPTEDPQSCYTEGQAAITAARSAMAAATQTYNKVRGEPKLPRVNRGGGVAGPRSDAARTSTALGAHLNKLAGSPKADAVVAVFRKSGYALRWAKRAERLGMQPEELRKTFVANPEEVHQLWTAKAAKK